jgi:hypothetical protein
MYIIGNRRNWGKILDLIHKYTNSQLIFDLVKVAAKTQTHFLTDVAPISTISDYIH